MKGSNLIIKTFQAKQESESLCGSICKDNHSTAADRQDSWNPGLGLNYERDRSSKKLHSWPSQVPTPKSQPWQAWSGNPETFQWTFMGWMPLSAWTSRTPWTLCGTRSGPYPSVWTFREPLYLKHHAEFPNMAGIYRYPIRQCLLSLGLAPTPILGLLIHN